MPEQTVILFVHEQTAAKISTEEKKEKARKSKLQERNRLNRIDNSEFMRNGDYMPTRFGAEVDAVYTIAQAKVDTNPENTVAVVSESGRPEVVLALTSDTALVCSSVDRIPIHGTMDLVNSFRVASVCSNKLSLLAECFAEIHLAFHTRTCAWFWV